MLMRKSMAGLLIGTGLAHIALFFANAESPTRIPVGLFGPAYFSIGLWLLLGPADARRPALAGGGACGLGFILGFIGALLNGFTALGSFLLLVDAAVVVLAVVILSRRDPNAV